MWTAYLTRRYWRVLLNATRRTVRTLDGSESRNDIRERLLCNAHIETAKHHALEGCTPCREWLTGLAMGGDEDLRAWLIDKKLCAESAFDFDCWLTENFR